MSDLFGNHIVGFHTRRLISENVFFMCLQVEPRYFHTAVGYDDYMAVVGGFTQYRNSSEKILIYKYRCNYWYTLDLGGKSSATHNVIHLGSQIGRYAFSNRESD